MSLKVFLLFIAASLAPACESMDTCESAIQEGPGLSGFASYRLGDGSILDADLDAYGFARMSPGTITIESRFTDAFSRQRPFEIQLSGMTVGTLDLAGHGSACMQRMTPNGPEVCSPLTGTIEIRALTEDCYWHESGIGSCAETMDFTLQLQSAWETTLLDLDGEMQTTGRWVTEEC